MRRHFLMACIAATPIFAATTVHAQSADTLTAQPIKIVVPFAPGGGTDLYARLISNALAKQGVQMIVENRPGASGTIAATNVARAKPDGRTLLLSSLGTLVSNSILLDKLTYDPKKDLRGVSLIGYQPSLLVARSNAPFKNVPEYVAYAKANPEKINRGSPGAAIITNLAPLAFENKYGIKSTHIPFNGVAPGFIALSSGQIDVLGTGPSGVGAYVKDGRMVILGVMGESRLSQFPDVPTFKEQGYEFNGNLWYGLSAPSDTPIETLREINRLINDVLRNPEFTGQAKKMSMEPEGSSPEAFDAYVQEEQERWEPELRRVKQAISSQ